MIGESSAFRRVIELTERVARFDAPVLIEGETGTGKELIARHIHAIGRRRAGPFVPLNCGAVPDNLFENELFGHRRGAFTDAREDQKGLVPAAHLGTLFLDEVDALSPRNQATLLRLLQDHTYRALGDTHENHADIRVIAATNRDLLALCDAGAFRRDLLYRLRFFNVRTPPLRERPGDARLLANHFVARTAARYEIAPKPISRDTLSWFDRYAWPGNVRELENLVSGEFLLCDADTISIATPSVAASIPAENGEDLPYREAKARAVARFQAEYLRTAMERSGGNISQAARLIGTERRHLGNLLRRHNIARQRHDPSQG